MFMEECKLIMDGLEMNITQIKKQIQTETLNKLRAESRLRTLQCKLMYLKRENLKEVE